jgi:acetyltransferase-like isoleucine patch superfamily enzyme
MANWFQHPEAIVETSNIGSRTRIWAFVHVLPGARIGGECNICDHVFIENDVRIGNRVTVKSGVQLWDGVRLDDDVFVGPNATFTNDNFPRSKQPPSSFLEISVRSGASIGANATILPNVVVGTHAMIGAGSVVTHDVPPHAIVVGNPARIVGYANSPKLEAAEMIRRGPGDLTTRVAGVAVHDLPSFKDLRGSLAVAELDHGLPFQPKRCFMVYDVADAKVRGEHAHRALHQFLICVRGQCSLVVDDGSVREEILLDDPSIGVHVGPMVWATQYKFSADAVLLVLASDRYDADDYIREYDEWRSMISP